MGTDAEPEDRTGASLPLILDVDFYPLPRFLFFGRISRLKAIKNLQPNLTASSIQRGRLRISTNNWTWKCFFFPMQRVG